MYYKVVKKESLVSAFIGRFKKQERVTIQVQYKLDKWVGPKVKGTSLFVFDGLHHALHYSYFRADVDIYECKVKNPVPVPGKGFFVHKKNIARFLFKGEGELFGHPDSIDYAEWPGAVLVDEVKLIKKVNS